MSIDAMKWAMEQDIFPSAAKFILVCLCDNAGERETVFPSLKTLCKKTSQDRKTVIACLDRLCDLGLLEEAGELQSGVKEYRILGLPDGDTHYVYQLTHIETGDFYIGVRTCNGDIESDRFFGSSRWAQEYGKRWLKREIIGIYATRKEAELAETFLVDLYKKSKNLKNKFHPKPKDVPKAIPVPKTVPVPKTELGSSKNGTGGSTENGTRGSTENGTGVVPKTVHRIINESLEESSKEPSTNLCKALAPKKSGAPKEKSEAVTNEAWAAYNTAYFNRYGTEMIETGKTRGQMMTFLKRVGREDAPHIAAFYVSLNNKYYVQNQHTLGALVSDAEALRTQWITGRTMTSARAAQIDSTATNVDAVNEAIQIIRRRNGNATV